MKAALEANNPTICWNIPCISYAARYGVGTISRKDFRAIEGILRDYTLDLSSEIVMLRKIESELHGDMQIAVETLQRIRKYVVTQRAKFLVGWSNNPTTLLRELRGASLPECIARCSTEELLLCFWYRSHRRDTVMSSRECEGRAKNEVMNTINDAHCERFHIFCNV